MSTHNICFYYKKDISIFFDEKSALSVAMDDKCLTQDPFPVTTHTLIFILGSITLTCIKKTNFCISPYSSIQICSRQHS